MKYKTVKCNCCGKEVKFKVDEDNITSAISEIISKTKMIYLMCENGKKIFVCNECYINKINPLASELNNLLGTDKISLRILLRSENQLELINKE